MSTAIAPAPSAVPQSTRDFKRHVQGIAMEMLASWVGEDRTNEAIGRITAALTASVASARDPNDFYACTPSSIAGCIALAALTGIMPGVGSTALAYVVPQRARKGEAPQLAYWLSHRGVNALARRCGQTMIPTPVGLKDKIQVDSDGEIRVVELDVDSPPQTYEELRAILILVKELSTGHVIHRGWVPKSVINKRKAKSRSAESEYGPWNNWPIEMAIKTAMHYAIGRGWCIIDDTSAARALQTDAEVDRAAPALLVNQPEPPAGLNRTDQLAASLGAKPVQPKVPSPDNEGLSDDNPTDDLDDQDRLAAISDIRARISAASEADLPNLSADLMRSRESFGEEVAVLIEKEIAARREALKPAPAPAAPKGKKNLY